MFHDLRDLLVTRYFPVLQLVGKGFLCHGGSFPHFLFRSSAAQVRWDEADAVKESGAGREGEVDLDWQRIKEEGLAGKVCLSS